MIGSKLGNYEILARIGVGGMGEVYRARDLNLYREVAVKILPREMIADPELQERLRREARMLAALNHPNIVTVYSVEETAGVHFLTMELLEGQTLDTILAGAGLEEDSFFELAAQLLAAMHAAHERGVVHRDLKPANVMVGADGRLKVLDFGLAKVLLGGAAPAVRPIDGRALAAAPLTEPGVILGTVFYVSPEQAQANPVDHRADIFSLGVILYEMATGRRPFSGRSAVEVISSILRDAPPAFTEGDPAWVHSFRPVFERCLEKDPEHRYQRVLEVLDDLVASRGRPRGPGASASATDSIRMGREALARHAWSEAFDCLARADLESALSSEDLQRLAEAALWTGKMDESCRFFERAYAGHLREGRPRRAALVAVKLADILRNRRSSSASTGWLKRAERLVEGAEDAVEYGYLLQFKTPLEKDPEAALRLAQQTFDIARKNGDANLEALSIQDQGRALVLQGKVSEGMALLDEAIVAALSADLDPYTVASTYCSMITACERVADYRRAGEWSQEARSWSEPHAGSPFPGLCSVYQARFMSLRGALQEAEKELLRVCADHKGFDFIAGEAFYQVGMIRLRRGDHGGAEEAFRQAHERGRNPVPGLPLLLLTTGKPENAWELIDRALQDTAFTLDRAKLLPARVRIALVRGNLVEAEKSVEELESIASRYCQAGLGAAAGQARGTLELAKGQFEAACPSLRSALAVWVEMDIPHEAAITRLRLAEAYRGLGDEARAELELHAARSAFERLGAADELAAVDVLIESS